MMFIELREKILQECFSKNGNFAKSISGDLLDELMSYTSFLPSDTRWIERVHAFLNKMSKPNKCLMCNKDLPYNRAHKQIFCNITCGQAYIPSPKYIADLKEKIMNDCWCSNGDALKNQLPIPVKAGLLYETSFLPTSTKWPERIFTFLNGRTEPYRCLTCGKILTPKPQRQLLFCSNKCTAEHENTKEKLRKKNYECRDKRLKTNLERYGCECPCRSNIVRAQLKGCSIEDLKDPFSILDNEESLTELFHAHTWPEIAALLDVSPRTVQFYLEKYSLKNKTRGKFKGQHGGSKQEIKLADFISQYTEVQSHIKINNVNIDLYIPEYNLAIEYDGVYWHTEDKGRGKEYHLSKTLACLDADVQLLHIWSSDNIDKWLSLLRRKFGDVNIVSITDTTLVELDKDSAHQFCDLYYMDDEHSIGEYNHGLVYKDELVTVASLKLISDVRYELVKFCHRDDILVESALDKLLIKNASFITFTDLRYSLGSSYESAGFELKQFVEPRCYYTKDCYNLYTGVDKSDSFKRIWDCGNLLYER